MSTARPIVLVSPGLWAATDGSGWQYEMNDNRWYAARDGYRQSDDYATLAEAVAWSTNRKGKQ
ncbi:MAG: hypothetical protein ACOYOQ_00370 [Microthrixaceae bacterium]